MTHPRLDGHGSPYFPVFSPLAFLLCLFFFHPYVYTFNWSHVFHLHLYYACIKISRLFYVSIHFSVSLFWLLGVLCNYYVLYHFLVTFSIYDTHCILRWNYIPLALNLFLNAEVILLHPLMRFQHYIWNYTSAYISFFLKIIFYLLLLFLVSEKHLSLILCNFEILSLTPRRQLRHWP